MANFLCYIWAYMSIYWLWLSDIIWRHRSWSSLAQVMLSLFPVCCQSSLEPMLTECQLDSGIKLHWNVNKNILFLKKYTFKNVICEMVTILFRPECVKWIRLDIQFVRNENVYVLKYLCVLLSCYDTHNCDLIGSLHWNYGNMHFHKIWKMSSKSISEMVSWRPSRDSWVSVTTLTHWGWVTYASVDLTSLAQIMACCLVAAKPLSEPMLEYCWLDPWEQTPVKC